MKIKIEKLYRTTEKKDGSKLTSKQGKEYQIINILSGGKKYVVFDYSGITEKYREGMTIKGDVEKNEYKGKEQYVLKPFVETRGSVEGRLSALEKAVTELFEAKNMIEMKSPPLEVKLSKKDKEVQPEGLPF